MPHHVRQGETVVRERVGEPPRVRAPQAELVPDTGLAQVGLDEENPRLRRLGQGASQVDRRRCLTVARGRARDRDHVPARLFHDVAEPAVLLGLERGGGEEAHQALARRPLRSLWRMTRITEPAESLGPHLPGAIVIHGEPSQRRKVWSSRAGESRLRTRQQLDRARSRAPRGEV